jgi:hypothetical protein
MSTLWPGNARRTSRASPYDTVFRAANSVCLEASLLIKSPTNPLPYTSVAIQNELSVYSGLQPLVPVGHVDALDYRRESEVDNSERPPNCPPTGAGPGDRWSGTRLAAAQTREGPACKWLWCTRVGHPRRGGAGGARKLAVVKPVLIQMWVRRASCQYQFSCRNRHRTKIRHSPTKVPTGLGSSTGRASSK